MILNISFLFSPLYPSKTISFSDIAEVVFEGYNGENRKEMLRIIDEGGYRYG